jgi:hypothetical protein
MPNIPLTEKQLTDIEARAGAATPGPWSPYTVHGPTFYANVAGPYLRGVGDLDFGVGEQAEADKEFVKHAQQDVTALVAAVRRLQAQRKYLVGQLAQRDAETGRGDQALREFLAANPGEDEMAASLGRDGFGPDEVVEMLSKPVEQQTEACGKCTRPFGPRDHRVRRAGAETAYCRGCVDACYDAEADDHHCVICA